MNTENEVKPPTMAPPLVKQEKTSINTHQECSKAHCSVENRVTNCQISELPPSPNNKIKQETKSEIKTPLDESVFILYNGSIPSQTILQQIERAGRRGLDTQGNIRILSLS